MRTTEQTTQVLKHHMTESLKRLRTLRDEVRVEARLAGMEVSDRLEALEARFFQAEQVADRAAETSKHLIEEALVAFQGFRDSLRHRK